MTQDEALKLAFDWYGSGSQDPDEFEKLIKAIVAQPEQGPVAWYDPSNGVVSTDRDCPLFTPLGQVWALYLKSEWVDLTDTQIEQVYFEMVKEHRGAPMPWGQVQFGRALLGKFKEANT